MSMTVISQTLVAAASYDLTDLATAKAELNIPGTDTTQDTWLAGAITQISAAIANYCDRVFPVETVQDVIYPDRDAYPFQVPGGVAALQLSRWPVIGARPAVTATSAVESGSVLPVSSVAGISPGMLAVGGVVGYAPIVGLLPVPDAAYVVTVDPVKSTVMLGTPIIAPVAAGAMLWFGLRATVTDTPGTGQTLIPQFAYQLDAPAGQLIRLNQYTAYPTAWAPVQTTVTYQAGYATIPADLVDATLRLMSQRWSSRGRDPMLKSQEQPGLGTQTYWVGGPPGVRGAFPQEIAAMLDRYRVPVTA